MTRDGRPSLRFDAYDYREEFLEMHTINIEERIEHYSTNNGVVLKNANGDVQFYISGDCFGVTVDTPRETVLQRALPVFHLLIRSNNRTGKAAHDRGIREAQSLARRAFGLGD